jgi:hypothetical protein
MTSRSTSGRPPREADVSNEGRGPRDGPSEAAVAEFVQIVAAAFERRHPGWHAIPRRPGQPAPPGSTHLPLARRRSAPDDGEP